MFCLSLPTNSWTTNNHNNIAPGVGSFLYWVTRGAFRCCVTTIWAWDPMTNSWQTPTPSPSRDLGCPALGSDLTVCYEILSKSLQRFPEEQIRTEICRLGPPRDILSIFFETYANLMCSNFFVLPQTRFSKIGSSPNLEKMSWPWVDSPFQLGARADFQKSSFGWSKKIGAHQISLSFRKNCQNVSRWSQSAYLGANLLLDDSPF